MNVYVDNTCALLREKVDKTTSLKISRDAGFPQGPAGRTVILNHMRTSGFSPEQIEQAKDAMIAAGIK